MRRAMMDPVSLCDNCHNQFILSPKVQGFPIVHEDLLRTNQAPYNVEYQQTLAYLEAEGLELERYDQEIIRLYRVASQLEKQRRALSARMKLRHSWLSPIRRVPVEILEEIFGICLSQSSGSLNIIPHSSKPNIAPTMNLGQVCYHWRQVVNTSPRMWCSLTIDLSTRVNIGALLDHYLLKSSDCLLDVDLTFTRSRRRDMWRLRSTPGDISPLYRHFSRIEKLNISSMEDVLRNVTSEEVSFPSLRSFSHFGHYTAQRDSFWSAIHAASPKLNNITTDVLLAYYRFPYHQLTTLLFTEKCDCLRILEALVHCNNLQSLKVYNLVVGLPVEGVHVSNIASLRHVSVVSRSRDITIFLQHLILPRLVSLEITLWDTSSTSLRPVVEFLQQTECRLSDLTLEIPYILYSDADLHDLLVCCSHLSRLEINAWNDMEGSDTFIYKLLDMLRMPSSDPQGVLVPNLTEVRVTEDGSCVDPDTAFSLLDMLESRSISRDNQNPTSFYLEFGELWGCPAEVIDAFNEGLKRFAGKATNCSIKWAKFSLAEGRGPLNLPTDDRVIDLTVDVDA